MNVPAPRLCRLAATVLAALCLTLAGGCVSVPDNGPVQTGPAADEEAQDNAPFFDPPAPPVGGSPVEMVEGFIDAMTANPLTTAVARKYLTDEASNRWVPEAQTVVYGSQTLAASGSSVTMQLGDTAELDGRGQWLGAPAGGDGFRYELSLVKELGEWRISNPPDALIVSDTYFESRFDQYSLYFFDKSAQILVPEPVYLPAGEQTPTLLIRGLLQGPAQEMLGAERTFLPASTQIDLSVPVSRDGVAEVPLSDEVLTLDGDELRMVSAQVVWTLRQVPGVQSVRITVDGSPVDIPGLGTELAVSAWPEFDPKVQWASEELFGIRDDRVVTLVGGEDRRIAGLFGTESLGLGKISSNLAAEKVAAVSDSGTTVTVAPRGREPGEVPTAAAAEVIYTGENLLAPAWDIYDQVWLIDNTGQGAVVAVARDGAATEFSAPGLSGRTVKAFELSRDGTRLVAVVSGEDGDRLVVSRVMRRADGSVREVSQAETLPVGGFELTEIRDIAWRTPETVAILAGPSTGLSQVILARIDGSSALGDVASNPQIFRSEAVRVVTSPAQGAPLYVGTADGRLYELAANGRWTGTSIQQGLSSPTFVG